MDTNTKSLSRQESHELADQLDAWVRTKSWTCISHSPDEVLALLSKMSRTVYRGFDGCKQAVLDLRAV